MAAGERGPKGGEEVREAHSPRDGRRSIIIIIRIPVVPPSAMGVLPRTLPPASSYFAEPTMSRRLPGCHVAGGGAYTLILVLRVR